MLRAMAWKTVGSKIFSPKSSPLSVLVSRYSGCDEAVRAPAVEGDDIFWHVFVV